MSIELKDASLSALSLTQTRTRCIRRKISDIGIEPLRTNFRFINSNIEAILIFMKLLIAWIFIWDEMLRRYNIKLNRTTFFTLFRFLVDPEKGKLLFPTVSGINIIFISFPAGNICLYSCSILEIPVPAGLLD